MFNPDKYRSVEWQKGGRAYPVLDCFGIVNEIRRDLGLAPWPDFAGVTKDDNGLDREARGLMAGLTRCDPAPGAGIACYAGSVVTRQSRQRWQRVSPLNLNNRQYPRPVPVHIESGQPSDPAPPDRGRYHPS